MLKDRFVLYDKVAASFQKFFNYDNLHDALAKKADISKMDT